MSCVPAGFVPILDSQRSPIPVLKSKPDDMESAGRLIGKLNRKRQVLTHEELARAAWPVAVGRRIAANTVAAKLVRKCLIVEVQDMVWQRQLNTLRSQILANLNGVVGPDVIDDIELRPMPPKRLPQRAVAPRRDVPVPDEADSIADPQLRRAYKISRQKATA